MPAVDMVISYSDSTRTWRLTKYHQGNSEDMGYAASMNPVIWYRERGVDEGSTRDLEDMCYAASMDLVIWYCERGVDEGSTRELEDMGCAASMNILKFVS